ncbi:MAG: rhodanese-like domain-containing protein [Bacteroidota bacterium]|nr:rhodanese-like domain-containing protein [Bacteroidota bacterium]
MKKILNYLLLFSIVSMLVFTSCKEDEPDPPDPKSAYETLSDYLTANSLEITDILNNWIITASDIDGNEADYYIMDIRGATDYGTCHITGAHNVAYGDVVTEAANAAGKPIVVACYTGQGAAHAVVALRLSGFPNAKTLKWGMSAWNVKNDKWTTAKSDTATGHAGWTTDATTAVAEFSAPDLTATATDGEGILEERVGVLLDGGFKGIPAIDVLTNYGDYFINNYWAQADVDLYGHIKGAYRINPINFVNLDPSKTIVTYCWTGQTSSIITAYLTVLGYDAKSLKFGANGMIYSALQSHQWIASGSYTCE